MGTEVKHGWFEIPGVQTGEHTLKARIRGLSPLLPYCEGGSILDVGCAEGLIGKWLMDSSPRPVQVYHGIEKHRPYIEMAESIMRDYAQAKFMWVDVDYLQIFIDKNPDALLPKYTIVLCLCLAQKLAKPEPFIRLLASRAERFLVLHLPHLVINDVRSNSVSVNTPAVLGELGFRIAGDASTYELSRLTYERVPS